MDDKASQALKISYIFPLTTLNVQKKKYEIQKICNI